MPAGIKWREGENELFIELTANWNLFFIILLLFCLAHKTNNEKRKNEVRQQIKIYQFTLSKPWNTIKSFSPKTKGRVYSYLRNLIPWRIWMKTQFFYTPHSIKQNKQNKQNTSLTKPDVGLPIGILASFSLSLLLLMVCTKNNDENWPQY